MNHRVLGFVALLLSGSILPSWAQPMAAAPGPQLLLVPLAAGAPTSPSARTQPFIPVPGVSLLGLDTSLGNLKPFGYDIFQGQVKEYTGPVDEDYVVGPRDELLIQTWGEYAKQWPLRVSDDGYIDLEGEERRVFVNGLTLYEVQQEVTKQLAIIHASIFNAADPSQGKAWVDVKAIRVRPILVYVAGEVVRAGTYSMDATVASLLNVLTNAGGIKANGSLRHVRVSRGAALEQATVRRRGAVAAPKEARPSGDVREQSRTEDYDLYDFLIKGDTKPVRTRLKNGDTVFIDLKRRTVAIRGLVQRPGIYEMLDTESVKDLLTDAGGPAPGAYLKRIQVIRRALNQNLRALDVDFASLNDAGTTFPLVDGDIVELFPSVGDEYIVRLDGGGVYRNGFFEFTKGMTLADLIEKGEGLRGEAYLEKADLVRTRMDYTKEYRGFSLKELYKKEPATGKVIMTGDKNNPANFPIQRLDWITIHSYYELIGKDKKVFLEGHVKDPGEHLLAEKMKLSDLLFAYGGFEDPDWRRATYQERAYLVRTLPEDLSTSLITILLRRVLDGDLKADKTLESMDRIIIRSYDEVMKKDKYVYLEGHIKQPGRHLLSENMRLSDVLTLYGGLEDLDFRKATYLERADLWRTDPQNLTARVISVALDKVLAHDPSADVRLQSLDRLVVYEYKDFHPDDYFTITGAVRDPGRYLLARNATLNDAIVMARGLLDEAYKYEAEIVRTLPAEVTLQRPAQVLHVPINENYALEPREKSTPLVKDDQIFIRKVPGWDKNRFVTLEGEVKFPGQYILSKADERLSDLVGRAGGLKETAYLLGAIFTRRKDEKSSTSTHVRVAIDLKEALASKDGAADLILRDGDGLRVPLNPMMVEVRGAVHIPATLQYKRGVGVDHYIKLCGGFKDEALKRDVLVLNPDGTTTRRGWGWFGPSPLSGSVIIVPPYTGPLPGRIGEEVPTTPTAPELLPPPVPPGWEREPAPFEWETSPTLTRFERMPRRPMAPWARTPLTSGTLTPEYGYGYGYGPGYPYGPYVTRRRAFETSETKTATGPTSVTLPPLRLPIP